MKPRLLMTCWVLKVLWAYLRNGEPFFVLRGRDRLTPVAVDRYVRACEKNRLTTMHRQAQAAHLELIRWQAEHPTKMPDHRHVSKKPSLLLHLN